MSNHADITEPRPVVAADETGPESDLTAQTDFPFGAPSDRGRRALRWGIYVAILLAAVVAVYVATRRPEVSASTKQSPGVAPATDAARSVMLSASEARRIGVTYAVAIVGPLSREIRTVGQVTFDETRVRAISPKIDGWVERLFVDFTGQPVREAAPLLAIYSPMLVTAQEELLLAKQLQADVAGGSEDARRSAAELLSSTRRRLAYWDIAPSDVERIERTGEVQRTITLRSPVSGFVIEKNVLQGQRIMAGEALYKIVDLSTVWVEGEVFEQDLPSVRLGQRIVAELQALPGEEFAGRITYVYPTLNPETRTVRVRVPLANPELRLKPGMYATLRVTGAASANALTIPRSAVLATGERSLVFIKRADGMLEPREIVTGAATDARIEILRGIAEGDTVVASATFLVDAESNLGSALGGMGNMPGMDMAAPTKQAPAKKRAAPSSGGVPPAPKQSSPDRSGRQE